MGALFASPKPRGIDLRNLYFNTPMPPSLGSISPQKRGLGQVISDAVAGRLKPVLGKRMADKAAELVDYTPVGNMVSGFDAGAAMRNGDWLGGGLGAALSVLPIPGPKKALRAFHVSPHDFDRFDIGKLGTGEGAQRYGRGFYFATDPKGPTVQHYRNFFGPKSKTYEAEIKATPDQLLEWDKPGWEQPDPVQDLLRKVGMPTEAPQPRVRQTRSGRFTALNQWGESIGTFTTEDAATKASMQRLRQALGSETGGLLYSRLGGNLYYPNLDDGRAVSALREAGVVGARYRTPVNDENLVVFDPSIIDITKRY